MCMGGLNINHLFISISNNMGMRDLSDIYAQHPQQVHIFQANPECTCYNHFQGYYMYSN